MRPTTDVEIKGKKYTLTLLPSKVGRRLQFRILKVVGPGITAVLRGGGSLANAGSAAAADAIDELVKNLPEELFEEFVHEAAKCTTFVGGDGGNYRLDATIDTTAFAGDYGALMLWIVASLKWNYASFLSDLGLIAHPQ
jgi:hypothetical protein